MVNLLSKFYNFSTFNCKSSNILTENNSPCAFINASTLSRSSSLDIEFILLGQGLYADKDFNCFDKTIIDSVSLSSSKDLFKAAATSKYSKIAIFENKSDN